MTDTPTKFIDYTFTTYPVTEAQRLFHGRGHAYPGLEHVAIDWLPPVVLITVYKAVEHDWLQKVASELMDSIPDCRSVQVQYRYQHGGPFECLLSEEIKDLIITESGLQYHIQLGRIQNPGLFLDMRTGRDWVKAHAQDKRVLNLFAYTCGFSVAAIAGGASYVLNVDNNNSVLSRGRENHRLNGHELRNVRFEKINIFNSWSRIKKHGPYDMLVCDPPTFQVGSVNIERDYRKIIRRLPEWMSDNGIVILCLNAPDLSGGFLDELVAEHCPQCEFQENIYPPAVFKESVPGKGLKIHVYRYRADT